MDNFDEILNAITKLWPYPIFLIIIIVIFKFPKEIKGILTSEKIHIKKGDAELLVENISSSFNRSEESSQIEPTIIQINHPSSKDDSKGSSNDLSLLMKAATDGDEGEANKAYESLQKSLQETSDKKFYEYFYQYLSYRYFNKESALKLLISGCADSENWKYAYHWLAQSYSINRDYGNAYRVLTEAKTKTTNTQDYASISSKIIDLMVEYNKVDDAIEIGLVSVKDNPNCKDFGIIYSSLATVYKLKGELDYATVFYEKALELDQQSPDNTFNAAFLQNEGAFFPLALINYRIVIAKNPKNAAALNNLGVIYDNLGLSTLAIETYLESSELNETLAMANIAYQYIDNGFISDAKELLDKARIIPDYHQKIDQATIRINEVVEKQEKESKELQKNGLELKQFMRDFANALVNQDTLYISEKIWVSKDNYQFSIQTDSFPKVYAEWGEGGNKTRIEGVLSNHAMRIKYKTINNWYQSDNKSFNTGRDGFAFFDKNSETLKIAVRSDKKFDFNNFTLLN